MTPLRLRLEAARRRLGLPWEILEQDYLLSWVLAGISRVEVLRESLVLKGGTALKKCYFGGDYRFSEDLDFSTTGQPSSATALEAAVREACAAAADLAQGYAPLEIRCERYGERDPHPQRQEAFVVRPLRHLAHLGRVPRPARPERLSRAPRHEVRHAGRGVRWP